MQPLSVQRNGTFLVDCSKLASYKDLTADDNGAWQPTGKPCSWFKVLFDHDGKITKVHKLDHKPAVNSKGTYALYRYYGRHSSSSDFRRVVATIQGKYSGVLYKATIACYVTVGVKKNLPVSYS